MMFTVDFPHTARVQVDRAFKNAPRWLRWALIAGITTTGLVAFGTMFDWNWLREPITSYVVHKTHRAFTFSDLTVHAGLTPTVRLREVAFANAPWAATASMARVGTVEFSVSLAALFKGAILLPTVVISDADVQLERLPDGRKNWTAIGSNDVSGHRLRIEHLTVRRSVSA